MLESSRRYFLYDQSVDMRKGFIGLSTLVISKMQKDLKDGGCYVFSNKRKNKLKVLLWEGDGMSIYYKSLEVGTFEHPKNELHAISYEKILLILRGIESEKIEKRKRYNFR